MTNFINDPLYSIALYPNDTFFDNLNSLFKKNEIYKNIFSSDLSFNYLVKAPFYLSHLSNENKMIDKFFSINLDKYKNILNHPYEFDFIEKNNNFHILRLKVKEQFIFFLNVIMRDFDVFRRTLEYNEIKIDLLRFNQLSEKELIYYQVWGYPYYFEFSFKGIPILDASYDLKNEIELKPIIFKSIKLLKQDSIKSNKLEEIASLP